MASLRYMITAIVILCVRVSVAQSDFDQPPINYHTAPVDDAIARLQTQLEAGSVQLEWDDQSGWLASLLSHLEVPISSQTLVFSKTSLQISRITPSRPRALYFNDDVYVGWVQQGDLVELSAVDPQQGPIFYTVTQQPGAAPEIVRDQGRCIVCHASSRTRDVPGYLIRSVFPDSKGTPYYRLGTTTTDHTTELAERFGGWYVTGRHGQMRHLGNTIASPEASSPIDPEPGANLEDLDTVIDTDPYLASTSDIVALMVLEHQSQMHNLITRAGYEARRAAHQDAIMNKLLERPADHVSDSAKRRIAAVGDDLLEYLLFKDQWEFAEPIVGNSSFAHDFSQCGIQDSRGRSLRDFDLQSRLFKYPCSYLIHSDSYAGLAPVVREYVEGRLARILADSDDEGTFDYLSDADRNAVRQILSDTLPGFRTRLQQATGRGGTL